MKLKKIIILIIMMIIFILGIIVYINRNEIKDYFVQKEKNNFLLETQNVMNVASNYFLRVLDPKIDKTESVVGEVTVDKLIEEKYLKEDVKIDGKIKISILGDTTNYIVVLSDQKYLYSGNYEDLNLETIKLK